MTAAAATLDMTECRAIVARTFVGPQGGSPFVACLLPFIEALGWNGDPRRLYEALPHFEDDLDIHGFRNTLANLGYPTEPLEIAEDAIDPRLLPCLFVPERGPIRILLQKDEHGILAFDGWLRRRRHLTAGERGTAYVVRPARTEESERGEERWLGGVLRRFRHVGAAVLAVSLAFNLLGLAVPLFTMSVYDTVIPSASEAQLGWLLLGVALALGFEVGFRLLRARSMAVVAGRIDNIVGTATFRRLLDLPIAYTESAAIGAQVSRLKEFEAIRDFFTGPLAEAILDLPFALLFLAIIFFIGGPLALIPVGAAALFVLIIALLAPWCRRTAAASSQARANEQRFLVEAIGNMRTLRLTGAQEQWLARYRDLGAGASILDLKVGVMNQLTQSLAQLVMLGSGAALVGVGAWLAIEGQLSFGALVATVSLNWRALSPLQSGLLALNRWEQVRDGAAKIDRLMRLPTERATSAGVAPRRLGSGITFVNVTHRYSPDGEPALVGASFDARPGEVVAVVGANGSGKSTIVKLASGLYRPQGGSVLIGGVDIRQFDPVALRQELGIVPQTSAFFYGTVAQNLRFADPTATDEALVEGATTAGLYDDIMALPQGFDTRLSEQAITELPAGFRQKLALARAYLRRPAILLLDEPGQLLDEASDRALMATIGRLRGKTTVLMVTHRPSHLRLADRVIVLERGRILFNGTPDEAMAKLGKTA
ncbi:MAG: peptidase domain-containing ABC transporter [Rhodospirillales bacterium]